MKGNKTMGDYNLGKIINEYIRDNRMFLAFSGFGTMLGILLSFIVK